MSIQKAVFTFLKLSPLLKAAAFVPSAEQNVKPLRIDGLIAAVMTPFDKTGEVDLSVIPKQQAYLKETGVEWVFVGGTTGESLSLTVAERKSLTEKWLATGTNVITHCGAESVKDARELATHAAHAGAKAVAAMPPTFFKPANSKALAMTIASICSAAPKLPCYYYHIPSMTGVSQPMLDFVKAIEPLAANFAGIKYTGLYTNPGFMDAQEVLNYKEGKFELLCGREEMMLEALSIGIKGHVGSQFNFAGDLFNSIREQFEKEGLTPENAKELRAKQMDGVNLVNSWLKAQPEGTNGGKFFMNLAGVPVGEARLPSLPLDDEGAKILKKAHDDFCASSLNKNLKMCHASSKQVVV
mmetsp:Transcript_28154/g.51744  ORF Transcript_28154/g.51744 Transcript_28154/m.51744 type:complete len:355 (-) Transcript_28154:46-1110(-)